MEVNESGSSDEACLQNVDNFQLLHPEILQEEGSTENNDSSSSGLANKQDLALPSRRNGSSSSSSSEESLIEVVTGNVGFTSNHEEEHKDEDSTSTMDIPTIQTMERNDHYDPDRIPESVFASSENLTPAEWSTASDESLFSIHPKTYSYEGDQASLLAAELHKEKELQKSEDSDGGLPIGDDKNIGKERQLEEQEPSQSKKNQPLGQDESKPPNATMIHSLNPSPRSDGSEGSDYSFAFPILVPNVLQSGSTQGDTHSSRRRSSRGHHLEAKNSNTRQQSPSPHKRTISCFCFSCHSCFSCCSCDSCCTRPSCFSFFTLPSCKSCFSCFTLPSCKSCKSCFSCFTLPSCKSCKSCSSCCTLPSCKSCSSCCTLPSWKSCSSCCTLPSWQSCLSCCNFPSCYSCCTRLSCNSCCTRLSCHSCFTCPSCKKSSCLSCWLCR